jgi:hypothetical protein
MFLKVGLSQSWLVLWPLAPVKYPLEEKPGSSSRNCLCEAGRETAVLSSVEVTHWLKPHVPLFIAFAPMGHATAPGNGKLA